jgi:hypothetical protein
MKSHVKYTCLYIPSLVKIVQEYTLDMTIGRYAWRWVLRYLDPRVINLARPSSKCTSKLQTHPLVREGAPHHEARNRSGPRLGQNLSTNKFWSQRDDFLVLATPSVELEGNDSTLRGSAHSFSRFSVFLFIFILADYPALPGYLFTPIFYQTNTHSFIYIYIYKIYRIILYICI